jgi:hypothetical protein
VAEQPDARRIARTPGVHGSRAAAHLRGDVGEVAAEVG